jgi:hypothetical protein
MFGHGFFEPVIVRRSKLKSEMCHSSATRDPRRSLRAHSIGRRQNFRRIPLPLGDRLCEVAAYRHKSDLGSRPPDAH